MGQKLSGKDIDVMIGDHLVHIDEATLSIEDSTAPVKTRGVPNGHVSGEVAASGEIKLDTTNFQTLIDAAKSAGSFRALSTFDLVMNGETTEETLKIEAFGCKFRISELLNANASGGEKLMHTLPYDVTAREFVRINGVPYVDASEIDGFR